MVCFAAGSGRFGRRGSVEWNLAAWQSPTARWGLMCQTATKRYGSDSSARWPEICPALQRSHCHVCVRLQINRPPTKLNLLTCQVRPNPEDRRTFDLVTRRFPLNFWPSACHRWRLSRVMCFAAVWTLANLVTTLNRNRDQTHFMCDGCQRFLIIDVLLWRDKGRILFYAFSISKTFSWHDTFYVSPQITAHTVSRQKKSRNARCKRTQFTLFFVEASCYNLMLLSSPFERSMWWEGTEIYCRW